MEDDDSDVMNSDELSDASPSSVSLESRNSTNDRQKEKPAKKQAQTALKGIDGNTIHEEQDSFESEN